MKIYISNIPDTQNYGSAMMVINALHYLRKEIPDTVFYTDCKDYNHLFNIIGSTAIDKIYKSPIVKDYWHTEAFVKDIARNYDAVLVLGGDDFSEYYTKFFLLFDLDIMRGLSEHMKVAMLGQTIGPFTPFLKDVAARSLKDVLIYTRDPKCLRYCKQELGLERIYESQDLSLLDLPTQDACDNDLLSRYGLTADEYVVLVPSGFAKWYCNNRKAYIQTWVDVITQLLETPFLSGKKIFLLPHDIRQSISDVDSIADIMSLLDDNTKRFVHYTDKELSPAQARSILGNGCYTITGRMHAGLSTLQPGKPAIFLSYSVKYQGVVGMGMGMPELVIEAVGDSLWEDGVILRQVLEKVRMVQENYDFYVERIKYEIDKSKNLVSEQMSGVVKFLRE